MKEYYDKNLINYIKNNHPKIFNSNFFDWFLIVEPILLSDELQKRKYFVHHENESLFDHLIMVSYQSFVLAKKYQVNHENSAIAGLLHDFYKSPWQISPQLSLLDSNYQNNVKSKKLTDMHGFKHPSDALENSNQYFQIYINDKICDAIVKHMFPMSLLTKYRLPKYKESWIVTLADKKVSFANFPKLREMPKYIGIKKSGS